MKPPAIFLLSLGCAKNKVDSEKILGELFHAGCRVVKEAKKADIIIINTCGFITDAKDESVNEILQAAENRNSKKQILVAAGCLSQRYREELLKDIPELDFVFGNYKPGEIAAALLPAGLNRPGREAFASRIPLDGHRHLAGLKVSEGCSHACSFCAIPLIKGRQVSRDIAGIIEEAAALGRAGVKELSLVAQDLSFYGRELKGAPRLPELLKALINETDIPWLRLMYTHPSFVSDELLEVIAAEKRICRYLDIPVQHASSPMLKLMRRGYDEAHLLNTIEKIRKTVPGISLRTTVLVGHPGETEEDFERLLGFLETCRFERLGGFIYSDEEGTWAHEHLKAPPVPEETARERLDTLMQVQQQISLELNSDKVGQTLDVMVDGPADTYPGFQFAGRTEADAPEIDNEVLIKGGKAAAGDIVRVKIENAWEFDLEGRIVDE